MNDSQLLRYSRHILLSQINYEGQEKLVNSHALVVGAGGLGSPVALYLAASGIGALTICDFDVVDLTNLQRQIIHTTQSVGINKAVLHSKLFMKLTLMSWLIQCSKNVQKKSLRLWLNKPTWCLIVLIILQPVIR